MENKYRTTVVFFTGMLVLYKIIAMRPDYPSKRFGDKRCNYILLIYALAMNCH